VTDSTIHDLDAILWMSGSKPKVVTCQGGAFNPEVKAVGDFDLVVATVTMENGVICVVDNGRKSAQNYDQRLEVRGNDGDHSARRLPTLVSCQSHYCHRTYMSRRFTCTRSMRNLLPFYDAASLPL
jgi:predicted dehydrogenase